MPKFNSQSGQAVLLVLLIMIVGLSIALGVFVDSLSNVEVTTTNERSERAFYAAEAGVETVLSQDLSAISGQQSTTVTVGDIEADVVIVPETEYSYFIDQNSTASFQLAMSGQTTSQLRIMWTTKSDTQQFPNTNGTPQCNPGDGNAPAGLIIDRWRRVIASGQIRVERYAVNPYACASLGAGFNTEVVSQSTNNLYLSQITLGNNNPAGDIPIDGNLNDANGDGMVDVVLRIRTVYNDADIRIEPVNGTVPLQSLEIVSTAAVPETNETRSIEVSKTVSDIPEIFDFVLFSGGDLVK